MRVFEAVCRSPCFRLHPRFLLLLCLALTPEDLIASAGCRPFTSCFVIYGLRLDWGGGGEGAGLDKRFVVARFTLWFGGFNGWRARAFVWAWLLHCIQSTLSLSLSPLLSLDLLWLPALRVFA